MTKRWVTWLSVAGLVVTAGLVWLVRRDESWSDPLQSAGTAGAALFAAIAAVGAALAADGSRKTARDAARSLLLHETPVIDPALSTDDDVIEVQAHGGVRVPRVALGTSDRTLRKVVRFKVTWRVRGERRVRSRTITAEDGLNAWYDLDGLSFEEGPNRNLLVRGDFVRIEATDDRGQVWTASAIPRGDLLSHEFTPLLPQD